MSRWISSVNQLLDNLDTNVGDVVENQVEMYDDALYALQNGGSGGGSGTDGDGGLGGVGGESPVDDILAKRGILNDDDDDEDEKLEEEEENEVDEKEEDSVNLESNGDEEVIFEQNENEQKEEDHKNENSDLEKDHNDNNNEADDDNHHEKEASTTESTDKIYLADGEEEGENNDNITSNSAGKTAIAKIQNLVRKKNDNNHDSKKSDNNDENGQIAELKKQLKEQKQQLEKTKKEVTAANKETRKLRRTVVKINAELDSAERELDAQRTELERAAVRMDKERQRYKEDKERMQQSHKEDMKVVMEEHKTSVDALITSHAEQMLDMEERIKRAEEARAKEGGDMSMELAEAAERERETLKKVMGLEDEKTTLSSQIASLNTQMTALQSRVESLQEASEVASEQEREAGDRLDAALSLHARQIGQRQAREAELERTIADIAAALVVARQREAQQFNNASRETDKSDEDLVELKEKLTVAEDEIEVFKAQIMLERQKSETLQTELEEISQERTQELSSNLARQKQYDRRVSDLSSKVTQLQSKLRNLDHTVSNVDASGTDDNVTFGHFQAKENEYKKQIATLSEDLLRIRGRLENTSTEVLTLRNRLRAALNRAEIAEKEAKASMVVHTENSYDIERGPLAGSYGNKTRRRFGGRAKKAATIRSVLKLDAQSGANETQLALAGTIDSLDSAAIKTLNYMRSDPFARIFFILYLLFLHVWVFCLLAFHAHGSLEPSANVGPEQLLKHSYRHLEQVHGKP